MKIKKQKSKIIFPLIAILVLTVMVIFQRETETFKASLKVSAKMAKGINVGNSLEAPSDLRWDVNMSNDYFDKIKEVGFDTVRIPVRFSDYILENGSIAPDFLNKVTGHVDYALETGLIVVLDFHHFTEIMEQPKEYKGKFINIWKQLSEHFKGYPEELIFELLNEPIKEMNPAFLNQLYEETVSEIRKTNPSRAIILGAYPYYSLDGLEELSLPTDKNLIISFHYYEPNDFAFQGNIYHEGFEHLKDIQWSATQRELEYLSQRFEKVENWAKRNNVPVFLGEFGITKEAPRESRILWTREVRKQAEERGFSWCYWELASGFGIYDSKAGVWDREMLYALVNGDIDE